MIIHDVEQGSQEWLQLRAGIPTASEFDSILTRKGKPSESRERYMLTLLAERLMGHPCEEHISLWMKRGKETEAEAIRFYELQRDVTTIPVGFVTDDNQTRGASPDKLVDENGMLEVKVPSEWIHMGYMLQSGKAYDKYMVQVQGQLLVVKGREWTDIMSYHPELPYALIRIERDEKYLSLLSEAVDEFSNELEMAWARIVDEGWGRRAQRPVRPTQDTLVSALRESLIALKK